MINSNLQVADFRFWGSIIALIFVYPFANKTYRINDYVKAFFPMTKKMIDDFSNGQHILDGRSILEQWFDIIEEQTQDYVNEDEIPKRRDRGRK